MTSRRKPRFTSRPWPREVPAGNAWLVTPLLAECARKKIPKHRPLLNKAQIREQDQLFKIFSRCTSQEPQLDYLSEWDRLRARAWLTAWERYA
jgi:hypothetical protein